MSESFEEVLAQFDSGSLFTTQTESTSIPSSSLHSSDVIRQERSNRKANNRKSVFMLDNLMGDIDKVIEDKTQANDNHGNLLERKSLAINVNNITDITNKQSISRRKATNRKSVMVLDSLMGSIVQEIEPIQEEFVERAQSSVEVSPTLITKVSRLEILMAKFDDIQKKPRVSTFISPTRT